jgi:hypothetical protein
MSELDHWFKIGADLRQEERNHLGSLSFGGVALSHLGDGFGVHLISMIDGVTDRPDHQSAMA